MIIKLKPLLFQVSIIEHAIRKGTIRMSSEKAKSRRKQPPD